MSLALLASVAIGEIFAAGEIAFIMQLGSLLEERTVAKARAGIEKLVRLTPRTARRVTAAGEESLEKIRDNDVRAEALRKRLEALVQADADAFAPLAAAYGLPKDTPEQAAHKAAVLEKALDAACAVPLEVMEKCAEGIALVEEYAAKGSVMAVSDAGCAAALCKVALQAASLNVFINTKLMADRERAAALDAKTDKLLDEFVSRADAVFASVTNKLRNK